ncbi:MAG: aminotransferase class I/II-fold pyridoxal phosphate-dependent enzyme [Gammaproteobacteria bacterium]
MSKLSRRGRALVDASPVPPYIAEHFARAGAPWDPVTRPDGYIGLCIAENHSNAAALSALLARYPAPPSALGYDDMTGNRLFRERLGAFMERTFLGRRFAPEQIAVLAGAGSVLEMLFGVLCDPGDAVLVPTPSYAGFWPDLETRDELDIVTVDCPSADGFRLTTARLDAALADATQPVRALLYTTPNNPLGTVASVEEVRAVADWARANGLHLVVDEIYALSVFGERAHTSVATAVPALGEDVHVVWAFSKDFGASGLRCGVLVSENAEVMAAVGALAYWAACSGHTQALLSALIADRDAVDAYLDASRRLLAGRYRTVTAALDAAGLRYLPAEAGFFLVLDLREYLDAPDFAAEERLWRELLERANVNLTPGGACRIAEPGFYRLCYAAAQEVTVGEGIHRLSAWLDTDEAVR